MRRDLLCMICCHSYTPPKGEGSDGCVEDQLQDKTVTDVVAEFDKQVLSDWKVSLKVKVEGHNSSRKKETKRRNKRSEVLGILESCKPLNITICGKCLTKMKNASSARSEAATLEQRVWELQLNLLQELKRLKCHMDVLYAEMKGIEDDVSNADYSCLVADLMTPSTTYGRESGSIPGDQLATRRKRVFRFRHQLLEVARDLQNYQSGMSERFGNAANRRGEPVQHIANDSKSIVEDIDMKEETDDGLTAMSEGNINQVNQLHDDTECENSAETLEADEPLDEAPENSPKPNCNVDMDNEGSQWDDAEVDKEKSDTSDDCDEEEESDEDYDPLGRRNKNIKFKLEEKRRKSTLEGMPEFTKRVVARVFQLMQRSQKKEARTLYQKSLKDLKYDEQRKVILLKGEVIHILDKEVNPGVNVNGLECGRCSFKVSMDTKKKMDTEMFDHILSKHLEVYRCPKCGVLLETYYKCKEHLNRRCPLNGLTCDICGKQLREHSSLRYHKFLHMNEEEKQQELAKGYKPPIYRKPTELAFQCQTCGKSFGRKQSFKLHLESHMSRDQREQLICPTCGKSILRDTWYYHLRMGCDTGVRHPPVQCPICHVTLKHKIILKKHMRYMHQQTDLVHTCEQCGKSFKQAGSLRAHLLTHSDLRPYKCDNCGATYKASSHLCRHKKTCKTGAQGNPERSK